MKQLKITLLIIGGILVVIGLAFTAANNTGGCSYAHLRPTQVTSTPAGKVLEFNCSDVTYQGNAIPSSAIRTRTNLPFGGSTNEGAPDVTKPWSISFTQGNDVVTIQGMYKTSMNYLGYGSIILGVIILIATLFGFRKPKSRVDAKYEEVKK